jgi:hypothetical protein
LTAVPSRPPLAHTSSASSLNSATTSDKVEAYKTPNHTSRYQTARSTDRTKLLSRSTLKGFGGPVKRSKAAQLTEDGSHEESEQMEVPPLPDLQEGRTLRRPESTPPVIRSTTPYDEPPRQIASRNSPPRFTTPLHAPPVEPSEPLSLQHHRMSPPRHVLDSIPATIPEDAELPTHHSVQLSASGSLHKSTHMRSASVSPDPMSASRGTGSHSRHRHSPSVPAIHDANYEKENRAPAGDLAVKMQDANILPSQTNTLQSLARDEGRRKYLLPEQETKSNAMDVYEVERSRASTLRAEGAEMMASSSNSHLLRPTSAPGYQLAEPEGLRMHHVDQYGTSNSVAPMYQTPAQAGPLRQAHDYNGMQSGRSAPPVPPQNYYTEMAAATPASTLPAGRKGLIVRTCF